MRRQILSGLCGVAMLGALSVSGQTPGIVTTTTAPTILEVPYLPQSSLLCGGAALAMVERWWGKRQVFAEDFASMVRPDSGGILTTDMISAAKVRGWEARTLASIDLVMQALNDSLPVIALIEVAPRRFHYVVLLGWQDGRVTFHDPAGAPKMSTDEQRFVKQWQGAKQWAMLMTPAKAAAMISESPRTVVVDSLPCSPWLDRAVDATNANQLALAGELLSTARKACPGEALVLRELAGLRFGEKKYAEVIQLTSEYLAERPDDSLAWQLLATARYLSGDTFGALEAWNRYGHPTLDLTRVDGQLRFTFQTLAAAIAIAPGSVLTNQQLLLAERRMGEIPALRRSTIAVQPVEQGLAELHIGISQKPVMMTLPALTITNLVRAVARDEIGVEIASPAKVGELWSASWRWQTSRPRIDFRLDLPTRGALPGVLSITGVREKMRTDVGGDQRTLVDEVGRTGMGFSAWLTGSLRLTGMLELEKWNGRREYLAMSSSAVWLTRRDRFRVALSHTEALSLSKATSYHRASLNSSWQSTSGIEHTNLGWRTGFDWISKSAPTGAWPVTGGNLPWAVQLRAHSAIRHDALDGRMVGRVVLHGGVSGDQPIKRIGPVMLAGGVFLDAARIEHAADTVNARKNFLDGGFGLRIGLAGSSANVISVDVARNLLQRSGWRFGVGIVRK